MGIDLLPMIYNNLSIKLSKVVTIDFNLQKQFTIFSTIYTIYNNI